MKKFLFLGLVLTSLSTTLSSCSDNKGTSETSTATGTTADSTAQPAGNPGPGVAAETYTCTMHPEVITNAPGKCPKCGMDLVKK